jgi:hypothetical protein
LNKPARERKREAEIAGHCRVARWFVFKPKIPTWEKFSGPPIRK